MDQNLIEKYKNEMRKMYKSANANVKATIAEKTAHNPTPENENSAQGSLIGIVTAIRSLYPVSNAKVTVFTGDYSNMQVIDSDTTNQSGRTKTFTLPTPERSLSLNQDSTSIPYSSYNMVVEADGYIKNIHLNIPVFSGITSLQQSNLILEETASQDKSPQIFDESQKYDL
ncbi:MAG: hypothetical protein IKB29_00520 [Clostridia bacterium]|nr:hypothetical protein [Clostridia bacterium]